MLNYSRFIGPVAGNRQPSLLREMSKILSLSPPEMIPLCEGLPNPKLFPFREIDIKTSDGNTISLYGKSLHESLQYLPTPGLPSLLIQLRDLQEKIHRPQEQTWVNTDMAITAGSQDGLCKALEMLMNVGSSVLIEDYVYAGTLSILNPYNPKYFVIQTDSLGMKPESLELNLSQWNLDELDSDPTVPKFIYINPTGANPTGTVLPEFRRKEIYDICCKYNLLILEDDPYFFLQFGEPLERPPSFLSLDTQGRVLRFDSFSKVLSSGIRLGFVTGPKQLIDRIVLHMQVSVLHASSLSQVITSKLLEQWGHQGFLEHVSKVECFYKGRRDKLVKAAEKHLNGLCEFSVPGGGMFLWIKVDGLSSTWDMIMKRAMANNILLMPGRAFQSDQDQECPYLRASFSLAPEEQFDIAMERLAHLIKEELKS